MNRLHLFAVNVAWRVLKRGPHSRPQIRRRDKVVAVPFARVEPPAARVRVAVAMHIFYPDLAPAMRTAAENIPAPADVYVSTDSDAKAAAIRTTFAGWDRGSVEVRVCPNRGRDMLSKFVAFPDALQAHDLVLFLHSKRSTHFHDGQSDWGDTLYRTLAGSPAIVQSILRLFEADDRLGVVIPEHFDLVRKWVNWGGNRRGTGALAERLGIDLGEARALDFPAGSMFWCRPAALKPLFDLHLTAADFPDEAGQIDRTLAHELERVILFVAEKAGYRWLKVVAPDLYRNRRNRIVVPDAALLPGAVEAAYAPLLPG